MNVDRTLAALAEPSRRAVIELLRQRPRRAGELAAAMGLSGPALSRHLKVLRSTGLVEVRFVDDDARGRLYRLRPVGLRELQTWIVGVGSFWDTQLAAYQTHATRRNRGRRR